MKKLPLQNTETKNIPIGSSVRSRIVKEVNNRPSAAFANNENDEALETKECSLEKPTTFTLSKLKKNIYETKNLEPNIDELVGNKLASPNTAKYIRKKKASKVNIAESRNLFKELVSLDVSGSNFIAGIEADLQRRACNLHPPSKPADPEPSLTEYFSEEEFLNVRRVGPADILLFPAAREPHLTTRSHLTDYTHLLLGIDQL